MDTPTIYTPKPQSGTWKLTAPDGRTWEGDSPLKACGAEQRERVPAQVALQRIYAACDDGDLPKMRAAFRTTLMCGTERKYQMFFSFLDLPALTAADAEWRIFAGSAG